MCIVEGVYPYFSRIVLSEGQKAGQQNLLKCYTGPTLGERYHGWTDLAHLLRGTIVQAWPIRSVEFYITSVLAGLWLHTKQAGSAFTKMNSHVQTNTEKMTFIPAGKERKSYNSHRKGALYQPCLRMSNEVDKQSHRQYNAQRTHHSPTMIKSDCSNSMTRWCRMHSSLLDIMT